MARGPTLAGVAVLCALAVGAGFAANQMKARHQMETRVRALTGGDAEAGRSALAHASCGGCHEIPGVPGAKGKVGPPLTHFAGRAFIGGRVQNSPDNLVRWIENPHLFDPQSAMPPMNLGDRTARDMAAYLYTLG